MKELSKKLSKNFDYNNHIEWAEEVNQNMKEKNITKLYDLLDNTNIVWDIKKCINDTLVEMVADILGNPNCFKMVSSVSHYDVYILYEDMPSYNTEENCSTNPPHGVIKIDFLNKEIFVCDHEDEFRKASDKQKQYLKDTKQKLKTLENELKIFRSDTAIKNLVKEMRCNLYYAPSYLYSIIKYHLSSSYAERANDAYNSIVKYKEKSYEITVEQIERQENKKFMDIYKKIAESQSIFLRKLSILGFEIAERKTEKQVM